MATFARGALWSLQSVMTADQFEELRERLGQLEEDIFGELSWLGAAHRPGGEEEVVDRKSKAGPLS